MIAGDIYASRDHGDRDERSRGDLDYIENWGLHGEDWVRREGLFFKLSDLCDGLRMVDVKVIHVNDGDNREVCGYGVGVLPPCRCAED